MLPAVLLQAAGDVPGWASLGVGGVLAGLCFYFYRQDRKSAEEKLTSLITDFRAIIEANTKAITTLNERNITCPLLHTGLVESAIRELNGSVAADKRTHASL